MQGLMPSRTPRNPRRPVSSAPPSTPPGTRTTRSWASRAALVVYNRLSHWAPGLVCRRSSQTTHMGRHAAHTYPVPWSTGMQGGARVTTTVTSLRDKRKEGADKSLALPRARPPDPSRLGAQLLRLLLREPQQHPEGADHRAGTGLWTVRAQLPAHLWDSRCTYQTACGIPGRRAQARGGDLRTS